MGIDEIRKRAKAAAAQVDETLAKEAALAVERHNLKQYWEGSISQSVMNDYKNNKTTVVEI